MFKDINLLLNKNVNFVVLEKENNKYIYVYNNYAYVYLKVKKSNSLLFTRSINNIVLKLNTNMNKNVLNSAINNKIKSIYTYFSSKIKFNGKGYKIRKTKKNISFFFNRAHINVLLNNNIVIKKIKKSKLIVKTNCTFKLKNLNFSIKNIRNNNIFTKRGLRLSRQVILKKQGKKNS